MLDELVLAERLISYDTSRPEEIVAAAGFVKGWLESRDIEVRHHDHNGLPVLVAEVGPADDGHEYPCVVFHGHLDVVPGRPEQFQPRVEGDRLIGRGAYDMKGGLAAMMCALKDLERQGRVAVRLVCVPDEESEEIEDRSTDAVVGPRARRRLRDHRRADQPAHRRRGQGRARDADRGPRPRRAQLDAVARRQRGAEGGRRVPRDRVAAVLTRILGGVRPAVDQPGADRGRRRDQQGARRVPDVGRHPLPPRAGPGGDPRADRPDPGDRRDPDVHLPAGQRRPAATRTCGRCATR